MKYPNTAAAIDVDTLYRSVRTLMFMLPVKQRVALAIEVEKKDWQVAFDEVMVHLSKKAKHGKYKLKDIPSLIEQIRQS